MLDEVLMRLRMLFGESLMPRNFFGSPSLHWRRCFGPARERVKIVD